MTPTTEIPIKVNCWVDERVAPLVRALNELEGVRTLISSAEDSGEFGQGAYVTFCYAGEGDAARFVADLTRRVRAGAGPRARLGIEWRPGEGDLEPLLTISCPLALVDEVAGSVLRPARPRALAA